MADTIESVAKPHPLEAPAAPADDTASRVPLADGLKDGTPALPPAVERPAKDAQVLFHGAEKASHELAEIPATVVRRLPGDLVAAEGYVEAKMPVIEALPLPDLVYGGGVLVAVVILQAIGMRLLSGRFEKRALCVEQRSGWWSVDLLLGFTVFRMLGLHLLSIVLWSAALVYGGIIQDGLLPHASRRCPTPRSAATWSCPTNGTCFHRSSPSRGCSPSRGRPASS
ncbi:hypothetical protein [Accumulibacter sp.]|uniref:hypothetical protein n=1 Tax=Accumulibacter sp. TaxID=2053492 RepID=UPI0025E91C8C|nr:hypothetical protein [Accumulibacter sp.]MCP5227418.1 hypothetical protein [Accumulibacter sp.]